MDNWLFKDIAEEWLQSKEKFVKESTYVTYMAHLKNHLLPAFSKLECIEIDQKVIQEYALYLLSEAGRKDGKGKLSDKTAKEIILVLKSCMKYAESRGYIPHKEMTIQYPAQKTRTQMKIFTKDERRKMTDVILQKPNTKNIGILISLYTGIRIGELCALKWSDIDMQEKVIHITKTLQRIYYRDSDNRGITKIIITTPKTITSVRDIPISTMLLRLLEKVKPENTDFYLLTNHKKYTEPRTYREFYSKFLDEINVRKLKFHSLRHTFASTCIELGIDYKTVSELLGHSNINTTFNLYVHPSMEQKRAALEQLESINIQ